MRRKSPVFILLISVIFFQLLACSDAKLQVDSVTVDNQNEAVGVDARQFNLSWKLTAKERSTVQTACQIVVASSLKDLNSQDPVWDSGKIETRQSILVGYTGPELHAGSSYFAKVKVWDNHGNESPWSRAIRLITAVDQNRGWDNAQWIGYEDLPDSDRVVVGVTGYGNLSLNKVEKRSVVPQFRTDFQVGKGLASATLFICGLGQYEASINGQKVGHDFLTPGWTHYDKTVLYNTYDVKDMLQKGGNAIGVIVGNGFLYNNRERYRKLIIAYGFPKMICKLQLTYNDGHSETIVSDGDWKMRPSPITYAGIYGGEDYDATLEEEGWDRFGFESGSWKEARLVAPPQGQLKPDRNDPVRVMETFNPVSVTRLNDSTCVYDFGQNASGIINLNIKGAKGQSVTCYPGEVLKEDGSVNQRGSGSPYYFKYTLKGAAQETWRPRFSYYGFRYVQVNGVQPDSVSDKTDLPKIIGLQALHTRNSSPITGSFVCSNELFNSIFNLINWGIKSNTQSVMTDCPTREKLGWLEQTHLVGTSAHYNFSLYNLYRKLIGDMKDAMTEDGLVPSIIPEYINFEYYDSAFRDSPEWGSAMLIQPWLMYKWYGDSTMIATSWTDMQKYFSYLEKKSSGYLLSHGLGDWYDVGPQIPGYTQLTPVPLVASAMYYYDAVLMTEIAIKLGKPDEAQYYHQLADKIKIAFNDKFYHADTKTYGTGSQTSMAMPLSMGIVPDEDIPLVFEHLVNTIQADSNRITAGDIGFHYLMDVLIRFGATELLYAMNNRDDVPGYGYQLKKGATALTESWQALETKSMDHMMLGHLMDWFYGGLAGIGQTPNSVAYREVLIAPQMVGDLKSASASFESPYGTIVSDWKNSDQVFTLHVDIPVNSIGYVKLPIKKGATILESGVPIAKQKGIIAEEETGDCITFMVGSGEYHFEVR